MHIVVIMDPISTVLVDEDTSFALMLEGQTRGHRVDHCLPGDLFLHQGRLFAHVRRATMARDADAPIRLNDPEEICLHDVDTVWVRQDPPFDSMYLWCTLMLDRLGDDALVMNRPSGLRAANEKLYACAFPDLMPETLVSANKQRILRFISDIGGQGVIKPLDGAGGEGVMALRSDDMNRNAIIEATTRHGARLSMVQAFLPAVKEGDKRILLMNGAPLGAILRVPQQGDIRSNIHVGGSVVSAKVDAADARIIERLAPSLQRDGLYFVGLDVIGGHLTEVNVTSPTGIQQMSRLDEHNYSADVLSWVETRVRG